MLGYDVITRIHELRLLIATTTEGGGEGRDQDLAQQQHQTLLLVARTTIIYICISTSLNLFIYLPVMRIIPFIAALTPTYDLTFALASHYCLNSRAGSSDVLLLLLRPFALLPYAVHRTWTWLQRRLLPPKAQKEVEEEELQQQQQQQQQGRGRQRWWWQSSSLKGGALSRHVREGRSGSGLSYSSNKDGAKQEKDVEKGCDLSASRIVVDGVARLSEDASGEVGTFSGEGATTRNVDEEEEEEELLFGDEMVVGEVGEEGKAQEKEALEMLREQEKGKRRSETSPSFMRRRQTMVGSSKAFGARDVQLEFRLGITLLLQHARGLLGSPLFPLSSLCHPFSGSPGGMGQVIGAAAIIVVAAASPFYYCCWPRARAKKRKRRGRRWWWWRGGWKRRWYWWRGGWKRRRCWGRRRRRKGRSRRSGRR